MKIKFNVRILCAVVSILFLFACGGGGGGSGAGTTPVSGGGAGNVDDGGNDNGDNEIKISAVYDAWNIHCWDTKENVERILDNLKGSFPQGFSYDADNEIYYIINDPPWGSSRPIYWAYFPDRSCQQVCDDEYGENGFKDGSPYEYVDMNEHRCLVSWSPEKSNSSDAGEMQYPGAYYVEHNHICFDTRELVEDSLSTHLNHDFSYDDIKNAYYWGFPSLYPHVTGSLTYNAFFPNQTCENICDKNYIENYYYYPEVWGVESAHWCDLNWKPFDG